MKNNFEKFIFFIFLIIIQTISWNCSTDKHELNQVLDLAHENRSELEKVLIHYEENGEKEKLKAARFLIRNMKDKLSIINRSNQPYNEILKRIDSIWTYGKAGIIDNTVMLNNTWDSLSNVYGLPEVSNRDMDYDFATIKSDYLIKHIDHAFYVWKSNQWAKGVNFEGFCEYILPYRIGTESLELWANRMYQNWKPIIQEAGLDSVVNISKHINDFYSYKMSHMKMFWLYPYDFNSSEFERIRVGSCKHGVYYMTQALRSLGIPTAIDYSRKWAGSNNGHEWNVIFLEDGSSYPFDAIHKGLSIDLSWRKIAKVYRKTYAKQDLKIDDKYLSEIPFNLIDYYSKDVTSEYVKVANLNIALDSVENFQYAIISTYHGFEWVPQCWGSIKNGKANFENIGVDNLYSVFVYHKGRYVRKSEPFLINNQGEVKFFKPIFNKKQDMLLDRKSPLSPFMKNIMSFIVGNKIQGGNTYNFRDSITFFTINSTPLKFVSVNIQDANKYRYVRMWIPRGGRGDIAELEFYGLSNDGKDTVKLDGNIVGDPNSDVKGNRFYSYPFDGDLLTYYLRPRGVDPWIGLDLKKPHRIVKVRYCPRSDTNFIEIDDEYELFLFDSENWKSQGRIKARDQHLIFQNIPSNGLYILVNLNKGVENKIFSYNNGKQEWM